MLAEDFPQIQAVASVYLQGDLAFEQEFEVAEDGIIDTPRVISGYVLDDYMRLAAMAELNFHFVNSHFQHPDDVLDVDRGADLGWEELFPEDQRIYGMAVYLCSYDPESDGYGAGSRCAAVRLSDRRPDAYGAFPGAYAWRLWHAGLVSWSASTRANRGPSREES